MSQDKPDRILRAFILTSCAACIFALLLAYTILIYLIGVWLGPLAGYLSLGLSLGAITFTLFYILH